MAQRRPIDPQLDSTWPQFAPKPSIQIMFVYFLVRPNVTFDWNIWDHVWDQVRICAGCDQSSAGVSQIDICYEIRAFAMTYLLSQVDFLLCVGAVGQGMAG